jgi:hypothetical protein
MVSLRPRTGIATQQLIAVADRSTRFYDRGHSGHNWNPSELLRAAPDRHRDHVCSPLAVGVDGARLSDAQGIDGLHDRRSDRACGDRYRALLLFEISQDRFRVDIGDAVVGCGADDRMDLAGDLSPFFHPAMSRVLG